MDTAITVIQVLLTLLFAVSGLLKLTQPYAKFVKLPAQAWANDFKPEHIRLIGILEVCAAIGIIVPVLLQSLTMLTPLAAVGHALLVTGYYLITTQQAYQDLGDNYFDERNREAVKRRAVRKLQQLGFQVQITPAPSLAA